jgi:hypothetical protein
VTPNQPLPHPPAFGPFRFLFLAAVSFCVVPTPVWSQNPVISQLIPGSLAPGKPHPITIVGENLAGATRLWTSMEPQNFRSIPGSDSVSTGRLSFEIALPKAYPAGIEALQLATTNGSSEFFLFMVDDLPVRAETKTNHAPASAMWLVPPIAVDGQTEELAVDYFQFAARKGETLAIEVAARRLGSPLDPLIRLTDAKGRELIFCDDSPGDEGDCRVEHRFAESGTYLLELRDQAYAGSSKHKYHLRLGQFPIVTTSFPIAVQTGKNKIIPLSGQRVTDPDLPATVVTVPVTPQNRVRVPVGLPKKRGRVSTWPLLSQLPEQLESEPNNSVAQARTVPWPVALEGRFLTRNDFDCFAFTVPAGRRMVVRGQTRSLGSPCDLFFQWLDAYQKVVAESVVAGTEEGSLTNNCQEGGVYYLRVKELADQQGAHLAYRIVVDQFRPGISLVTETNRYVAEPGAVVPLKISCTRYDYAGPIKLSFPGLIPGAAVTNELIEAGKTQTVVNVTVPLLTPAGTLCHFQIVGAGDSTNFSPVAVTTTPALRRSYPALFYHPPQLEGVVSLSVKAGKPPAR